MGRRKKKDIELKEVGRESGNKGEEDAQVARKDGENGTEQDDAWKYASLDLGLATVTRQTRGSGAEVVAFQA